MWIFLDVDHSGCGSFWMWICCGRGYGSVVDVDLLWMWILLDVDPSAYSEEQRAPIPIVEMMVKELAVDHRVKGLLLQQVFAFGSPAKVAPIHNTCDVFDSTKGEEEEEECYTQRLSRLLLSESSSSEFRLRRSVEKSATNFVINNSSLEIPTKYSF